MNYLSTFLLTAIYFSVATLFAQETKESVSIKQAQSFLAQKAILFQENKGQIVDVKGELVPSVLFKTAAPGVDIYITTKGLVYVFSKRKQTNLLQNLAVTDPLKMLEPETPSPIEMEWLQVHLEGAEIRPENILRERAAITDYRFFLPHCPNGITGVKEYEKITIKEVYPGIDWVLYGSSKTGMKYDFVVHPGADPARIQLLYEGEHPLEIDEEGNIEVQMRLGKLTENAPVSFFGEANDKVNSSFKSEVVDNHHVRINYQIDNYPKDQTLTIDPQLTWGTRFGENGIDLIRNLTHDSNNNIFVVGYTTKTLPFPVLNPGSGTYFQNSVAGPAANTCPFILKFNSNGALLWSTLYGGSLNGGCFAVVCDANDNVFVAGDTNANDLPVQDAGTYFDGTLGGSNDIFILKFDNNGVRLWATYYGATNAERAHGIVCDPNGNIFIAGYSSSTNLPLLNAGTYYQTHGGGFDGCLLKFDNAGNRLWATYYGGLGVDMTNSISCDDAGNIFVVGYTQSPNFPLNPGTGGAYFNSVMSGTAAEAFILKFDNLGNQLWATYYGGSDVDIAGTIAIDPGGNVFVLGHTQSANFPVQDAGTYFDGTLGGTNDIYLLKFNNNGVRLWATYYGGSANESELALGVLIMENIKFDGCGNVYIASQTLSTDIPTLDPAGGSYFDNSNDGGGGDFILARFSNSGVLLWATYLGGSEYDKYIYLDIDSDNNLYVAGAWGDYSTGNLLANPGGGAYYSPTSHGNDDGYIFKFIPDPPTYTSSQTSAGCDCQGTASVTIAGGIPPFTYTWSNGDQTVDTLGRSNGNTDLCAGNHWVEITSCGVVDTIFFSFPSAPLPPVTITADDTSICEGACVSFSANTISGATYAWTFGDGGTSTQQNPVHCYTTAGNYTVTLTITDGQCSGVQTNTNYIQVSSPVPGINVDDQSVCVGQCSNFTANTIPGASYNWNFGDGNVSIQQNPVNCYVTPGNYTVSLTVTTPQGCTATETNTNYIQINALPTAVMTADDQTVCLGTCSNLSANTTAGATYVWNFGDGGTSTQQNPLHCYSAAGNYTLTLTVTDAQGCSATQTNANYIEVNSIPVGGISANPLIATTYSPTVNFVSQSTGEISWHWNFGDALPGQSDASSVAYTYSQTGTFLVSLAVANAFGCTDTAFVTISILEDVAFYAPNAFTPDGDGINDKWIPQAAGVDATNYNIKVFNRWGELVWQTSELTEGWNGTFNGQPVPDGVYTWTAKVTVKEIPVLYNGSVNLVR